MLTSADDCPLSIESQNTHLKAIDTQLSEALLILENSSEAERSSLLELVAQTNAAAETLSNSIASDLNSFKSASESWAQEVFSNHSSTFAHLIRFLQLKARSADGSAFEATLAKASAELSSQMTGFELQVSLIGFSLFLNWELIYCL